MRWVVILRIYSFVSFFVCLLNCSDVSNWIPLWTLCRFWRIAVCFQALNSLSVMFGLYSWKCSRASFIRVRRECWTSSGVFFVRECWTSSGVFSVMPIVPIPSAKLETFLSIF